MSIRSALVRISLTSREFGRNGGRAPRYFSDSTGRVLGEEERAKEAVYIQVARRARLHSLINTMLSCFVSLIIREEWCN
jgi:hypothetical protein